MIVFFWARITFCTCVTFGWLLGVGKVLYFRTGEMVDLISKLLLLDHPDRLWALREAVHASYWAAPLTGGRLARQLEAMRAKVITAEYQ